ncbi:MAG: iron-containing alcohol dehydrogenase [Planctomycetota bacterium]|nr:iron-containing alcohol dehydrogenase [Planctomycetota bacterium]
MNNFEYANPVHVIFGPGESSRVGSEASKLGKKALLVSYKEHAFFRALLDGVTAQMQQAGMTVTPFFEVTANPLMSQVRAGVVAAQAAGCDVVVAVGGGSAMDSAKMIAAGVLYSGDLWNMIVTRHDHVSAVPPERALPLLMVPTLPATASEMNCGAVVTNEATHEKSYVFAGCLFPKVSIVDPALTATLPAYQTACGAADAISHALETYVNPVGDTPLQDRLIEGVILTTIENVRKALADPSDLAARANLQWSAIVAWNGWTYAGCYGWAPIHQFGHVLSARFNVTHGASLSIFMPAWMKHTLAANTQRYAQFAQRVFGVRAKGKDPQAVALRGIALFEKFLKEIGVPTRLRQAKVDGKKIRLRPADVDAMVADVIRISTSADGCLGSIPKVDREGIRRIFELAH